MRCFLAGLIAFLCPVVAFAQVRGEVESIGFQNFYRPDAWTPMTVKLIPETGKTDFYQIQVKQEDMDRDRAIFTRTVSVTGNAEGQSAREQRFRVYFIPEPTRRGLPGERSTTLGELEERLTVDVCTENGQLIARLPITSTIINVDPIPGSWENRRGTRFILAVTEGRSQLLHLDTVNATGLLGVVEDMHIVHVRPDDLPENVIGYDAIDGMIWLDADPASLRAGGEDKRRALESYVRRGGRLVICQHSEWQKSLEFGELLPVMIQGMGEQNDLLPLRNLARPRPSNLVAPEVSGPTGWDRLRGPFRVARAIPKGNAVVDEWVLWDSAGNDRTPYIARHLYGLGSVTWVAQDLADPTLTSTARSGWPYVWDRVFDWKNVPIVLSGQLTERDFALYAPGPPMDLSSQLHGMVELFSKTAWLVTLAIVFFIAYWLVAGPGVFAYLLGRKKTQHSWFAFAATALVATGLTVLLVRLVLRGPPELRHFTVVRAAPEGPAVAHSRLGLYIPRDGDQHIELKETAANSVTALSALAVHPAFLQGGGSEKQGPEYMIPVVDASANESAAARMPYSSTLKRLQATWIGEIQGRVEGSGRLLGSLDGGFISGSLTNGTGRRLRNVYIAFAYPGAAGSAGDWVLYLPFWEDGITLDLNHAFNRAGPEGKATLFVGDNDTPEQGKTLRGRIGNEWSRYWYTRMRARMMESTFDDSSDGVRRSFPLLSFFDRLPPTRNEGQRNDRVELIRRGGRNLDLSHALAAGALVVLAEADEPLPFPLEVEGDRVTGQGKTLYQFLLPLDRAALAGVAEEGDGGGGD
jgi:hypothetical protein